MLHVAWKEQYAVQHPLIDSQHQKLISILNDLIRIANRSSSTQGVSQLFHQLVNYAREHFSTEEQILQQVGYPDFSQHREAHLAFIAKLLSINEQYDADDVAMVEEIIDFLKNWLFQHILEMDLAYASYIKGVEEP